MKVRKLFQNVNILIIASELVVHSQNQSEPQRRSPQYRKIEDKRLCALSLAVLISCSEFSKLTFQTFLIKVQDTIQLRMISELPLINLYILSVFLKF